MSPNITDHLAPEKVARIAGGFYLAYILASVLATMLANIGLGEAQQVYQVSGRGVSANSAAIGAVTGLLPMPPCRRRQPSWWRQS